MTRSVDLDAVFAALAHPARRQILAQLAEREATVNDLAEPFEMSLPAVSKHIRVLEDAGLVSRRQQAQFRYCSLHTAPLEAVAKWTDHYRHIWTARFDRMETALKTLEGDDP